MMAGKKQPTLSPDERLKKALVPTEKQPYEIPENWCWTTIGQLCSFIGGGTPDKSKTSYWNGNIPWASVKDVKGQYLVSTIDTITEDGLKNSSANMCEIGDLIIITRIEPAKAIVSKIRTAVNQDLKIVKSKLASDFLYYYFSAFRPEFERKSSGSTVQGITLPNVQNTEIPLPPLAEQKRIVDTIVDLFADLDKAAENAQTIIDGYEVRKNAILYQAFNGDLTEEWRKANAVSEQWDDCVLLDVLKDKPRNGYSPQPVNYPTKYKSMTLSATTSGTFAPEHFKYIDEEILESSHLWMVPGDILIQRANSLEKVGTSAIYTGGYHEFIYPDLMMKLQVKDGVSAEFIAYQLKTQTVLTYFRSNATGTAGNMPKINQQVVSSAPMRIPTLAEQQEIVRILDELLGNEQRIKEAAEEMLDKIAMMKKSILADAFRGKLGTNDPADDPATELLRQILA